MQVLSADASGNNNDVIAEASLADVETHGERSNGPGNIMCLATEFLFFFPLLTYS